MKCEAYRCGEHSVRKLKNGKCEYVQRFKIKTEYGVINKSLNCVLDRKYRKAIAQEIMDNASYFNRLTTNNLYKDYKKGLLSKNNSLKPKRDYRIGSVKTKAPIQYATDKEVCLPKFLQ